MMFGTGGEPPGYLHWRALRMTYSWAAMIAASTNEPLEARMPRERFHHHATPPSASGAPPMASPVMTALPHEHQDGAVHVTHVSKSGRKHVTRIPLADYHDQSIEAARQAAEAHFSSAE